MNAPAQNQSADAKRLAPSRLAALLSLTLALVATSRAADEKPAAPNPAEAAPAAVDWKSLFDGKSLAGWTVTDFAGHGEVSAEKDFKGAPALLVETGVALSGVTWTNDVPKNNFEIELEAMPIQGGDFFCGLTIPYNDAHCTFVVGGWGGSVVGLSSINHSDASENETTKYQSFERGRWYRIRVKATPAKIEAWIDKEKMLDLETADRKITMRFGEIERSVPLGIATYQTKAAFRNIRLRKL